MNNLYLISSTGNICKNGNQIPKAEQVQARSGNKKQKLLDIKEGHLPDKRMILLSTRK